ncbi:DUF1942 domain-containing protein [Mycobacteroides sp. LB1]|nr:DUF1942 domain-containing protein [Mycobacteroides sp. LB1]
MPPNYTPRGYRSTVYAGRPVTTVPSTEGQRSAGTVYLDVPGPDPMAAVYAAAGSAPAMMKDCPCCQDMPAPTSDDGHG